MNQSAQLGFPTFREGPLLVIQGAGGTSPMAVDAAAIESLFRAHGALLLRGFDLDVGTFRRFAERLCTTSVFNESPNRALLDPESDIQSVDLGIEPFPLHPELSREPWRPDACLFACLRAPGHGGETTVCDGVELVKRLPAELVAAMRPRNIFYFQQASPEALEFWLGTSSPTPEQLAHPPKQCPYFFLKDGDRVIRGFGRPLLHKPMFSDEPAFANFLLFARDYQHVDNFPVLENGTIVPEEWMTAVREAAAEVTHDVAWQAGDIVILDNSRFMHGRRAIIDPDNRMIASYFGYIGFAPRNAFEPPDPLWRRSNFRAPIQRIRR
ncbi:MAG TPA: TauD/TfdA family dioxygenase [Sphingomicrobium sp.]|nr:TauD/TfdA family dioxygenase [Sphingomicrobium sp.]